VNKVSLVLTALLLLILATFMASCGSGGGDGNIGGGDSGGGADTIAPSIPTNLTTIKITSSQINLSWSASIDNVGVTGYKVYRDGTYLTTVITTSVSDTARTGSTSYCYAVSAFDAVNNESLPTNQYCVKTKTIVSDTGQTQSYTTTFGEDHDYAINLPFYMDNGNGTVTDNITGLMWQQQDDATTRIWDDAGTYCNNLTIAGYSDWRLPSYNELISIADYGTSNPAINTTYFTNANSLGYWSSSYYALHSTSPPLYSWYVNFMDGLAKGDVRSVKYYVRCVRGEQSVQAFYDNGNGTVSDRSTGLLWQKGEYGTAVGWESVIIYCEGLSLGGGTDWRLPNVKELSSIIDTIKLAPAANAIYFPNIQHWTYWSSTTYNSDVTLAWQVSFDVGSGDRSNKTDNRYARCVSGGQ
jgi:hypothetical protein